jgi:hypothetical protein
MFDYPPVSIIEQVTFYRRDLLTIDLLCCEVQAGGRSWTFDEEAPGWTAFIQSLDQLPGFRSDWRAHIIQPPFQECRFTAYSR